MRYLTVRDGVDQLGAVADDAALLGFRSDHESGDVVQEHQRCVTRVAQLDELGALLGLLREQDAVVAEQADREPVDRAPAADQLVAVQRLELLEAAAVEHPRVDLTDVERDPHVGRGASDQLVDVVDRIVGRLGRAGPELLPAQVADDVADHPQRVHLVVGEVVAQTARAGVHLGAAQRLFIDDLVDRHLHQGRTTEVRRAALLDEDRVVAHPRRVRTAGSVRPEHGGDGRDAQFRQLCLVLEALAAPDEDVGLMRQVGTGRLVQVDPWQPVPADDLVEPHALVDGPGVHRTTAVGHVARRDGALDALDDADADDRADADRELAPPSGEWAELEERRVGVDQLLDPFARQHLAALSVPIDVALTTDRRHRLHEALDLGPQAFHRRGIRPVVVGARVET